MKKKTKIIIVIAISAIIIGVVSYFLFRDPKDKKLKRKNPDEQDFGESSGEFITWERMPEWVRKGLDNDGSKLDKYTWNDSFCKDKKFNYAYAWGTMGNVASGNIAQRGYKYQVNVYPCGKSDNNARIALFQVSKDGVTVHKNHQFKAGGKFDTPNTFVLTHPKNKAGQRFYLKSYSQMGKDIVNRLDLPTRT